MLSAGLAFYAIVGGVLWDRGATAKGNQWAQLRIFDEVLFHIVRDYVDEPDMTRVRMGALRGLTDGLDPYSAYLTSEQVASYKPIEPGLHEVGGMALSKVGGFVYVVSVLDGSPAYKSGIRNGDFIEYVGKAPTRDMSLYDAELLLGPIGSEPIQLRLFRAGQSVRVDFTPGPASHPALEARVLEPGIGYVKLSSLPAGRAAEAREAINQLTAKGVKRLVLDLRGAALGSLEEGAAVADLFIDEGVVARKVGRGGVDAALIKASREATVFRGPLSVLVDYSTAGGAEVTAAALLQSGRGVLVGAKTFGAGVELGMFPLRDGGALLLTVARFADPQGRPFVVEPVAPTNLVERAAAELVVPDEDDDGDAEDAAVEDLAPKQTPPEDDVQLKKAVELLKASEFPAARAA